jgi:hypothetical protein
MGRGLPHRPGPPSRAPATDLTAAAPAAHTHDRPFGQREACPNNHRSAPRRSSRPSSATRRRSYARCVTGHHPPQQFANVDARPPRSPAPSDHAAVDSG